MFWDWLPAFWGRMTEKAGRGEAMCHPAFGYSLIDGKYVPNEAEAPVITKIFTDFVNGKGEREIAQELGNQGVRTHRGNKMYLQRVSGTD